MTVKARSSLFADEDLPQKKTRMAKVLRALRRRFPEPACALIHGNPYQLLAATILSAQCTDDRVNMVTPELFRRYPTPQDMALARQEDIAALIRSTGFFQNKSRNLLLCSRKLVEEHGGVVPRTMEELVALPGVGRKTANVVLGNAFGVPGYPVDTHVRRIANLLEFTDSENPEIIEQHLCEITPKRDWTEASHLFILHGRATCIARRPACLECVIEKHCPSSTLENRQSS